MIRWWIGIGCILIGLYGVVYYLVDLLEPSALKSSSTHQVNSDQKRLEELSRKWPPNHSPGTERARKLLAAFEPDSDITNYRPIVDPYHEENLAFLNSQKDAQGLVPPGLRKVIGKHRITTTSNTGGYYVTEQCAKVSYHYTGFYVPKQFGKYAFTTFHSSPPFGDKTCPTQFPLISKTSYGGGSVDLSPTEFYVFTLDDRLYMHFFDGDCKEHIDQSYNPPSTTYGHCEREPFSYI